jgi:hypothetical protein
MFGNKCKCKTKICKCGKRKIGGVVGESGEERELSEYEIRLLDEQKRIEVLKAQVNELPDIIKGLKKKISEHRKKITELKEKETRSHSQSNLNNIEKLNREIEDLTKELNTEDIKLEQAKKSLKYVTDAENKSTRAINTTEKPPNKGIYNFSEDTNIYCFSDIESNMPSEIKELMFQNTGNKIDYTPIDLLSTKRAIVFTGDLIDRGAYTIRNLSNMLKLKEKYPDNVILIGGNRDINKIRMYHECCIPSIESTIFISNNKPIADIIELLKKIPDDKIFKHSICEIADTINIQGIVNPLAKYKEIPDAIKRKIVDINFVGSYRNDIFRIKDMYANTLGSLNQIKFFRDEFIVLFGDGTDLFGFTDDDFENDQFKEFVYEKDEYKLLLKFIAMMNMVMGKYRKEDTEEYRKLPQCLQKYNGLYIKYIEKNHIMAAFTKKNNLYIASHSGIPYGKSASENDGAEYFFIPSEIGKAPFDPKTQNYATNIEKLNSNFNTFITKIKENKVNYNDEEFKKYVAMAASCLDITITGLDSIASPVVSSLIIDKMRKESVNSLNILNNGSEYKYSKIYNIFGHQPGGFTPYVNRVKDDGGFTSYHINLDISKAENPAGISNKKSYVYLLIDGKGTEGTEGTDGVEGTESTGSNASNDSNDSNDSNVMLIGNIENNAPYVDVTINSDNTLIQEAYQEENPKLKIKYNIKLDDYCDKKIQNIKCIYIEKEKEKEEIKKIEKEGPMFLVDNAYYGMFGYKLVKFDTKGINAGVLQSITMKGGKKKINKIYIKSNKRYMYGKRRMVIYLGKRGCEYVKTAGEYLSLAKFIRTNNKNKNKK